MEGQIVLSGNQLLLILGGAGTIIASLFGMIMKMHSDQLSRSDIQSDKWAKRDAENNKTMTEMAISNNNLATAMSALAEKLKKHV